MNEAWLVDFFKDLHAHPELGMEEFRTTDRIRAALRANGVALLDADLTTGAVARIGAGGPVIGLRCDIDALPIQEASGLAYASVNPGRMHACGHDFHTSVMLGAAILLKRREPQLKGTVKVVFQPSEEVNRGATTILATGLLDDAREFYGVHSYPFFPAGTLGIKEGPVMAATDRFAIRLKGKGAHGAQPHKGVDPIPAAATVALAVQSIVSRAVDPFAPTVVSVTRLQAGSTWNVVPETAELEGTVRTFSVPQRDFIRASLRRIADSVAAAYGCSAEFEYEEGPDPVVNDAGLCAEARAVALDMGFAVDRQEDTMSGEDFSEYLKRCPGAFIRVGTGGGRAAHTPRFCVDPAAIWPAANFFAELAARRCAALGQQPQA